MASKFWCCFVLMIAMRIANGAPQLKIQTDEPKEPTFVEKHNKLLEWLNFFDDFSATSTTEAPTSLDPEVAVIEAVEIESQPSRFGFSSKSEGSRSGQTLGGVPLSEFIESKPQAQDLDSQGLKNGPIQNPLPTFVESKAVEDSKGPTKSGQIHGNPTPSFAESKPIHDSEDSKSGQNPTPTFAGPKQIQDSQGPRPGQAIRNPSPSFIRPPPPFNFHRPMQHFRQQGPHQMGPHQMGPHQMGPHQMRPQHLGPQHLGPQQMGPQHLGPQQMGTQQLEPQEMGPQKTEPRETNPTPTFIGSQSTIANPTPTFIESPSPINSQASKDGQSILDSTSPQPIRMSPNANPTPIPTPTESGSIRRDGQSPPVQQFRQEGPHHMRPQTQPMRPTQMGSHQMKPQQIGLQQTGPHQMGPPQMGPQQMGPHHMRPQTQPMRPTQIGPQQMRSQQQMGPQQIGPQQMGPQHIGHQHQSPRYRPMRSYQRLPYPPRSYQMYRQMGSFQMGPQQMGSYQTGPQQMGPQQMGPQQMGPQYMGPQQMGPYPTLPPPPPQMVYSNGITMMLYRQRIQEMLQRLSQKQAVNNLSRTCSEDELETLIGEEVENLPKTTNLPGYRCYNKEFDQPGRCVESSCTQARFCGARGHKIKGKCKGSQGDYDKFCCTSS